MFAIIISEKGGAERRETFDKDEVNVGRVQGNELMLPKGNVSKHHSRLIYRDGRFIVTDLKSTNGTYVNGRKIAQPTIVREGDKIYIGDFILRVDGGSAEPQASDDDATGAGQIQHYAPAAAPAGFGAPPAMPPLAPAQQQQAPSLPAPPPMRAQPPSMQRPAPAAPAARPPAAPPAVTRDVGSTARPENPSEPVDGPLAGSAPARMPGPPRMPSMSSGGPAPRTAALAIAPQTSQARTPSVAPPPAQPVEFAKAQAPAQAPAQALAPPTPARPQPASVPSRLPPRESSTQTARRLALVTLIDRVCDVADLAPLDEAPAVDKSFRASLERLVAEQAKAMAADNAMPEGVSTEALAKDAVLELVGLGAIASVLEDEEAVEIHCMRHDQLVIVKATGLALADNAFTSDVALGRTIVRLAALSGQPVRAGETSIERHLPRGAHMIAFRPPGSQAHALIIRKQRRVEMSTEDFVRLGALNRSMASFVDTCLLAKVNLLVCGSTAAASGAFLGALAGCCGPGERVVVTAEDAELSVGPASALRLHGVDANPALIGAAARTRPDRWVVGNLSGPALAATLEVIGQGAEGVLASSPAPSLRQGLARLVSQLLLARPGMSPESARSCLADTFDIAIEVQHLTDGRTRISRIAELAGVDASGIVTRDLFIVDEGSEGYTATGVIPRVVSEFASRGMRIDMSAFKKPVR